MAKTNQQIVEAFLDGKPARGESLSTDGSTLMSYSYPLAWHHNELGRVRYNIAETGIRLGFRGDSLRKRSYDAAYSPTTNRHRQLLIQALVQRGFETVHAYLVMRDVYEYRQAESAGAKYGRDTDGVYRGEID